MNHRYLHLSPNFWSTLSPWRSHGTSGNDWKRWWRTKATWLPKTPLEPRWFQFPVHFGAAETWGFMSANEDFNILKTAVLKKSDEIPAQRQYAPLAWEFVLGFAHKNLESLTLQFHTFFLMKRNILPRSLPFLLLSCVQLSMPTKEDLLPLSCVSGDFCPLSRSKLPPCVCQQLGVAKDPWPKKRSFSLMEGPGVLDVLSVLARYANRGKFRIFCRVLPATFIAPGTRGLSSQPNSEAESEVKHRWTNRLLRKTTRTLVCPCVFPYVSSVFFILGVFPMEGIFWGGWLPSIDSSFQGKLQSSIRKSKSVWMP